jgi:hypothetical protein
MDSVVFMLFLLLGSGITILGWRFQARARASKKWPQADGTLLSVQFDDSSSPDSSPTSYQTNVRYSYTVRGVHHEGSRIAFGYTASRSREMESAFFTSLKNAPSVKVKYNPVDPSESTLDSWPGKPAGSGLIGVGILWVAVTLIFMVLSALSRHPTL